ncbi:MAG TPA: hypothetical protein VK400_12265, partial [Pyrinomonadaceae bacterium]|nr:hypothetical protein [Pyrinomonadaceae bacterium]
YFDAQLSAFETNMPKNNPSVTGFDFGVDVGNAILALRANDPGNESCGYRFSPARGRHRVDPDNPGQGFLAPFYGYRSRGFAISTRHALDQPPFDNNKYKTALKEVRAKGIKPELTATLPGSLFGNRRDAEETTVGIYWAYDGANRLGTPPRLYNQIIREVAAKQGNNEGANARLFAFVNAAMGDAGILAWEQKYCHDFWRPVVGIREHDETLGPRAPHDVNVNFNDGDPFWLPLGAPNTNRPTMKNFTPNFPAYPSGHATFGAAAFHITRLFYGKGFEAGGTAVIPGGKPIIKGGNLVKDDLFDGLGFVSEELNGMNQDNQGTVRPRHVRSFNFDNGEKHLSGGLGRMIIENALSRVYLGVHWMFDAFAGEDGKPEFNAAGLKIGGVPLGLKIAEDIFLTGGGKAPKLSTTTNPPENLPAQPSDVAGCADNRRAAPAARKAKGETAAEEPEEKQKVETPYLSGTSRR